MYINLLDSDNKLINQSIQDYIENNKYRRADAKTWKLKNILKKMANPRLGT